MYLPTTPLSGSGNHKWHGRIPIPFQVRIREHHTNPCVHEKPQFGAAEIPGGVRGEGAYNLSNQQTFATLQYYQYIHISFFHAHPKVTHFHISCWYLKTFDSGHELPISVWCVGHSESMPFQQPHHFSGVFFCKCFNSKKIQRELTTRIVNCELKETPTTSKRQAIKEFWKWGLCYSKKNTNMCTLSPFPFFW